MKILIIGCGMMGSWFADFFARHGHKLYFYDVNKRSALILQRKNYGTALPSLSKLPEIDGVLVSVPIRETGKIIRNLSKLLDTDNFIIEISSFKGPIWKDVVKARQRGILCISIHPLFGPGKKDLKDSYTVHVKPSDLRSERMILRRLLDGTRFVTMSPEEHDSAMGIAISLTHLVGVSFGSTLVKLGYDAPLTKSLSTALSLIAISYSEPISFYSKEVLYNKYSLISYNLFMKEFLSFIRERDIVKIIKKLKNVRSYLGKRYKISRIYKEIYSTD
ncbi:MAG: prephenate dehydrogenase [Nitrososphaerota archaeon]